MKPKKLKDRRVINIQKSDYDAIKEHCDKNALDLPKWMVKNSLEKIHKLPRSEKTQKILDKLKFIVSYYNFNRQVGHTFRMLNGVLSDSYKYTSPMEDGVQKTDKPNKCLILAHNTTSAEYINDLIKKCGNTTKDNVRAISFTENSLRGHSSQILIDNALLFVLFSDCINAIENDA